jgi:hypothetical protein
MAIVLVTYESFYIATFAVRYEDEYMSSIAVTNVGVYTTITRARYRGTIYIHYTTQVWRRVSCNLLARYGGDCMAFIPITNGGVSFAIMQERLLGEYIAVIQVTYEGLCIAIFPVSHGGDYQAFILVTNAGVYIDIKNSVMEATTGPLQMSDVGDFYKDFSSQVRGRLYGLYSCHE